MGPLDNVTLIFRWNFVSIILHNQQLSKYMTTGERNDTYMELRYTPDRRNIRNISAKKNLNDVVPAVKVSKHNLRFDIHSSVQT